MIKASISKINSKKSRSFLFLTLELAEYPDGLAELSLLAEYHHGTRRVHQAEEKQKRFFKQQTSNQCINSIETNLGSDTTDGF